MKKKIVRLFMKMIVEPQKTKNMDKLGAFLQLLTALGCIIYILCNI